MKNTLRLALAAVVFASVSPAAFADPNYPAPSPVGDIKTVVAAADPNYPAPSPVGDIKTVVAAADPNYPAPSPVGDIKFVA